MMGLPNDYDMRPPQRKRPEDRLSNRVASYIAGRKVILGEPASSREPDVGPMVLVFFGGLAVVGLSLYLHDRIKNPQDYKDSAENAGETAKPEAGPVRDTGRMEKPDAPAINPALMPPPCPWEGKGFTISNNEMIGFYRECLAKAKKARERLDCGDYPNVLKARAEGQYYRCCKGFQLDGLKGKSCEEIRWRMKHPLQAAPQPRQFRHRSR